MEPREENRLGNAMHVSGEEARARYEILRVVNRGGMGEIALGRVRGTKGFEKLVVLKRLRADAERDDHLAMFDVEQELMSRIEHPNIVKVFDQPIIDNTPYLAMEYVRGRNLDQVIRQAKDANETLSLQFCLTSISEVLRGLAFVHRLKDSEGKALGVVHQDITPSNIMVSFFGEVKITDFGISYVTSRDGGLRRGVLKGKPRYVAPEVLAGKRVNNRADIYGVGVVLFELVTQSALFARPSVKETLAAVARGELPDFRKEIPNLTEGVLRIFERSLAKDPQDRYRTAEEMGADVVAELAKLGGSMSPARLGYVVRQFFRDDPDVPEVDQSFEAALSAEAQPVLPASFRAPDLSQTLSELDRLLPRSSTDLFTLPPELKKELAEIKDGDPFMAATPIPDFVWDAPNDEEILRRADEKFGTVREPPSLRLPEEKEEPWSPKNLAPPTPPKLALPSFEAPKRITPLAAPAAPATLSPDEFPAFSAKQRAISTSESSPPPSAYTDEPRDLRSNGKRPVSGARPVTRSGEAGTGPTTNRSSPLDGVPPGRPVTGAWGAEPAQAPRPATGPWASGLDRFSSTGAPGLVAVAGVAAPAVLTPIPPELLDKPTVEVDRAPEVIEPEPISAPREEMPLDAMPPAAPMQIAPMQLSHALDTRPVDTTSATFDRRRNFSFWLGLAVGLALGMALGAAIFSYFIR